MIVNVSIFSLLVYRENHNSVTSLWQKITLAKCVGIDDFTTNENKSNQNYQMDMPTALTHTHEPAANSIRIIEATIICDTC